MPTDSVIENGKAPTGIQHFYCQSCLHSFQLEYRYNAHQTRTRAYHKNGYEWVWGRGYKSCTRDYLYDSDKSFKKLNPPQVIPLPFEKAKVTLPCEVDEQWSYTKTCC